MNLSAGQVANILLNLSRGWAKNCLTYGVPDFTSLWVRRGFSGTRLSLGSDREKGS